MPDRAQDRYQVRTMAAGELEFATELAAREGWNPGLSDAESFFAADSQGFFVGVLDGEPIGCISAVSYQGKFGFIGLYIVVPRLRGNGYGLRLWQHAMNYLDGQTIGLDGVVEQQGNYRKSGFFLAHRNIRYGGAAGGSGGNSPIAGNLRPLSETPIGELVDYDRRHFPANREAFLRAWVRQPGATGLAAYHGDRLSGYGVLRPCREGYKIGPLFADHPDLAEELFNGLNSRLPEGTRVFLDLPEPNTAAIDLAERHGMSPVFETARMYARDSPQLPLKRVFGITTFELG